MPRTVACAGFGGWTGGELAGGGVDAEDAEEIRSEVWDDEVLLGRVSECCMWVRSVLAGWVGAGAGYGEAQRLQDFGAGCQGQLVGRNGGAAAADY